ncbi:hypothetical protein, partial [Nostoc sp. 'Peltigera membranacea cyanobiont' 213]|uniref:hypothetical protein n=1 Tax=Nostoc sp. 'Peltigera membranacea cyanobiont' 213 TaxID=2014530 RepID=UPI001CB9AC1F
TAAPSPPFKMIIIIVGGIVYFMEVPNLSAMLQFSRKNHQSNVQHHLWRSLWNLQKQILFH